MNKTLKAIVSVVGIVAVVGALAVALVHFWDDLKDLLPCCCKHHTDSDFDDFEDYEA